MSPRASIHRAAPYVLQLSTVSRVPAKTADGASGCNGAIGLTKRPSQTAVGRQTSTRISAPPLRLALAGLAALATILVLVWRPTAVWLGRLVSPMAPLQPLAPSAVFAGTLLTVLSWSTYGAALWML